MELLIFGDSITFGAWDTAGGWVARLTRRVNERFVREQSEDSYVLTYNLGVSGDDTADVLARLEQETRARTHRAEDTAILFAVGVNDSQYLHDEGRQRTPLESFEENLRALIEHGSAHAHRLAFVGLTPAQEEQVDPIPWNPQKSYTNERIHACNGVIMSVCEEKGVLYIPVADLFEDVDLDTLLFDGLHPNDEGHARMARRIGDTLEEAGWL